METKRVLVTVGTTKFPKLIEVCSQPHFKKVFMDLGYTHVQLQTGTDWTELQKYECIDTSVNINEDIVYSYKPYFDDFQKEILKSDLIISHAGSGTCLEVLKLGKKLIAVINEDLMDNHQLELAEKLHSERYLFFCTCNTLKKTLLQNTNKLRKYPSKGNLFKNYLNDCMGFT